MFFVIGFCKIEPRARDILSRMSSHAAFDEDVSSAGLDFAKNNENKQRIPRVFARGELSGPLKTNSQELSGRSLRTSQELSGRALRSSQAELSGALMKSSQELLPAGTSPAGAGGQVSQRMDHDLKIIVHQRHDPSSSSSIIIITINHDDHHQSESL